MGPALTRATLKTGAGTDSCRKGRALQYRSVFLIIIIVIIIITNILRRSTEFNSDVTEPATIGFRGLDVLKPSQNAWTWTYKLRSEFRTRDVFLKDFTLSGISTPTRIFEYANTVW